MDSSHTNVLIPAEPYVADRGGLGVRARLLRALEPWFPPLQAPQASGEHAAWEFAKAAGSYEGFVRELGGIAGRQVLDFGCGWGGESAWLAQRVGSTGHVTGVDICRDSLDDAERFKSKVGLTNLRFVHLPDDTLPFAADSFDAVFSTNVFEHVMNPEAVLAELFRVLRPGGSLVTRFGPLFYSPLGYHLPWAVQVPYAHLLFGLQPIIEVRNTRRSPIAVTSWEETGLNRMRFGRFQAAVMSAGFDVVRLARIPVRGLHRLAALPMLGDLLTFGIDCHVRKPGRA